MTRVHITIAAAAALAGAASAQPEIPWESLDSGATVSSGSRFTVAGTVAQQDAGPRNGPMTGQFYTVTGGFWQLISVTVDPGCNVADVAEPFGILDLTDINVFVVGFITQQEVADIAPPFGLWDLDDLILFIQTFTDGCP